MAVSEPPLDPDRATPLPGKEPLLVAAKRTLEMIASGTTLATILEHLCLAIDGQNPAMMSTVLLVEPDGERLRPAAGPRVPRAWPGATAPVLIAPDVGSCGAAAFHRELVVVSDIASDPRWSGDPPRPSGRLAVTHGICASWSQPLLSKDGQVLGTFCMYYPEPRTPSADAPAGISVCGPITRTSGTPSVVRPWMRDLATRECSTSPTIATVSAPKSFL